MEKPDNDLGNNKIKAIVYHSFEEGEAIERKLMDKIPFEERLAKWNALVDVFANQVKKSPTVKKRKKK